MLPLTTGAIFIYNAFEFLQWKINILFCQVMCIVSKIIMTQTIIHTWLQYMIVFSDQNKPLLHLSLCTAVVLLIAMWYP